ncbi:hypothetical protein QO006_002857 [Deinococcus enclensis]|uniref:Uncharacterized protein n=1 Tax=Deinococcus enclensis TaxID=1049582 RepID=A0ABT9MFM7_9DEIO|nr:hypothetical protein [Deinococcus enclensis]
MGHGKVYAAVNDVLTRVDHIKAHECRYRSQCAPEVSSHLQASLDGTLGGPMDVLHGYTVDLLGWRLLVPLLST